MLGGSLLLLWIGSIVFSRILYSAELANLEQDVEKRTELFTTTLLDALLSEDIPILESALEAMIEIHPDLIGAEFCNYNNTPLLHWGESIPNCESNYYGSRWEGDEELRILTNRLEVVFHQERFGVVALRWDLGDRFDQLKLQVHNITRAIAIGALLMALMLFVMVRILVVRPIHRVDHYLRRVESREEEKESLKHYSSKELIHLCEGVEVLQESMEREEQLSLEREQLLATLEEKVKERTHDLRQSNDQLTSIMENMKDPLFLLNQDNIVVVSNPAARSLFPEATEQEGTLFVGLFPGELQEKVSQLLRAKTTSSELLLFEDEKHDRGFFELTYSPLLEGEEEQQKLVLVRDVTEQRVLEEKEQMIAFQSGIAEMSSSVMHNIGNVLAGLTGQIYKVKKGGDSLSKMQEILQHLATAGKEVSEEDREVVLTRSSEMMNLAIEEKLLEPLRRIEHGIHDISEVIQLQKSNIKPTFQLVRFHPRPFLYDVVAMLEPQSRGYGVEVNVEVETDLTEVHLPRNQLFQAVVNLVKNGIEAASASSRKERLVEIQLIRKLREGRPGLQLTVEDNGAGIEQERIDSLFVFGESSKSKGSGVGLHASGNFINSFGGTIKLESDGVEQGAKATVWLPLEPENRRHST